MAFNIAILQSSGSGFNLRLPYASLSQKSLQAVKCDVVQGQIYICTGAYDLMQNVGNYL